VKKVKILVVEDEHIIAKDIQTRLKNMGYMFADLAYSGEGAVKKAIKIKPDLILMDIKLKGEIDGIDAATKIHKVLDVPIIFLTAYADEETLERAKITEPFGYIVKPIQNRELNSAVQMAIYKHRSEREKLLSRDQLKNIIDGATESIVSIDKQGLITAWNKAISGITGISDKNILKTNISDVKTKGIISLIDLLESTLLTKKSELKEHKIKDKNGNIRVMLSSVSIIKGLNKKMGGVVFIGRDITYQRQAKIQMIGGNSYIAIKENFNNVFAIFNSFKEKKYSSLLVSRGNIENRLSDETSLLLMNRGDIEGLNTEAEPKKIFEVIKSFFDKHEKTVVLLHRIEYISSMYGFDELLKFLYNLNDLVKSSNNIIMMHIAENCFTETQLEFFKQEFDNFPLACEEIHLEGKKKALLKFVSNKNSLHETVNFNIVSKEFDVSRRTIKTWLNDFQIKRIVRIVKKGRKRVNLR